MDSSKWKFLLLFLHCVSVFRNANGNTETKNYPCPLDTEFLPCVCTETTDMLLNADCSAVKNHDELALAFKRAQFPFYKFNKLTIDHSGCSSCSLQTLTPEIFSPISFVDVEIHGTKITTVEDDAFTKSEETLISLDLSSNKINSFGFEVLASFKVLETLNLQSNALDLDESTEIPQLTSASLKHFYLSNNPKILFDKLMVSQIPTLVSLHMSNVSLIDIPLITEDSVSMFDGLSQLKSLDFSSNSLTELQSEVIDTGTMSVLETVDFSNNQITTVHRLFINQVVANGKLDLRHNLLDCLEEDVWKPTFSALGDGSIDLTYNPLLCGCEVAWIVRDAEYVAKLAPTTTCLDGVTLFVDLKPEMYADCPPYHLCNAQRE